MAAALTAITDRVHFAYNELVNWTLVTDGDGVMLIDSGFPGNRDDVLGSLRQLGFGVDDMRAILLTHAHIDHFGTAIWFAKTHGIPVYCHSAEVGHAKREYLEQVSPADLAKHFWQPKWLKWSLQLSRKGALTRDGIPTTRWHRAPAPSCCRRCSTTTSRAACAAWPRWGCSTPRCCCPATGRCGGAPFETRRSRRHPSVP